MKSAKFITKNGHSASFTERIEGKNNRALTLEPGDGILNIKKEFSLGDGIDRVILRATALGVYCLYLNGKRVGNDEMLPGWTDYRCRVFESQYDITEMCQENNLFVCDIASGWWNGRISFGVYEFKPNAFAGEIEIIYHDGKSELISSDEGWQVMVGGQIRRADIWDGQYTDMTLPHPSVDPEYYTWENAVIFDGFEGEIVPFEGNDVRVRDELSLSPVCGYIYDDSKEKIPFEQLPNDWVCPLCMHPKSDFELMD